MTPAPDTHAVIALELVTMLMKRLIASGALSPNLVEQAIDAAEESLSGYPDEGTRSRVIEQVRNATAAWTDRYPGERP